MKRMSEKPINKTLLNKKSNKSSMNHVISGFCLDMFPIVILIYRLVSYSNKSYSLLGVPGGFLLGFLMTLVAVRAPAGSPAIRAASSPSQLSSASSAQKFRKHMFEMSDVLFREVESQNFWKCMC